jgi:hypothetical protein
LLNCRRPFDRDLGAVDYDIDSEEEWGDLYADDVDNDEESI